MSVISSRKPCCKRSRGMTSFSIFSMKSPVRSAFKCMDTLRANMELSWLQDQGRGSGKGTAREDLKAALIAPLECASLPNLSSTLGLYKMYFTVPVNAEGNHRGRLLRDSTAAERTGPGAAGPGRGRAGHGVLYLTAAHAKESPSRGGSHGPVREDERLFEAAEGTTFGHGGRATPGGIAEKTGRSARAIVQGSARADHPEMQNGKANPSARDFREPGLWRTGAAGHADPSGCDEEDRSKRVGK